MERAAQEIFKPVFESAVVLASHYCKKCQRSTVTPQDMRLGMKYAVRYITGRHVGSLFPEVYEGESSDDDTKNMLETLANDKITLKELLKISKTLRPFLYMPSYFREVIGSSYFHNYIECYFLLKRKKIRKLLGHWARRVGQLAKNLEKRKNVHAFVIGDILDYCVYPCDEMPEEPIGDIVTYDPYKFNSFVLKNTKEPVFNAKEVDMINAKNKIFIIE